MTTLAALLGLPLALGTGEGAELRRPLGIAIVGGLIFSQMLTLYDAGCVFVLDRCDSGSPRTHPNAIAIMRRANDSPSLAAC